jgi:hypothetical protein
MGLAVSAPTTAMSIYSMRLFAKSVEVVILGNALSVEVVQIHETSSSN